MMARCDRGALRLTLALYLALLCRTLAQIKIMTPRWLIDQVGSPKEKGRIYGSTATFGAPFYGERILGRVVYGESKGQDHCTDDDYSVPAPEEVQAAEHSYKEVRLIHIVMVRRGKCSFVTKVNVAKKKGAHAVIVVDKEDSTLTSADIQKIIVADDGYGTQLDIPSVLISKQEGNALIEAVKRSQLVVELMWDIPTKHVVQMDMWMSSGSLESQKFMIDLAPKRRALKDAIKFVPHFHVFMMKGGADYNELCSDSSAQYCAEDPDGAGPITGKMVLEENVRQLCIHELTKVPVPSPIYPDAPETPEYSAKFWDYVERHPARCPMTRDGKDGFGLECSESVMASIGIDAKAVQECAFNTKEDKLREQRENTAWSPRALRINGWRYNGVLDADVVTRAICSGFTTPPAACQQIVAPLNPFKPMEPPKEQGVSMASLVGTLAGTGLLAAVVMLLYKRSMTRSIHTALREEVMLEVQAQMDQYKQMGN